MKPLPAHLTEDIIECRWYVDVPEAAPGLCVNCRNEDADCPAVFQRILARIDEVVS